MKKIIAVCLCIAVVLGVLSGCGVEEKNSKKMNIVTTIFPIYDWVKNLTSGSGDIDITMLLDNGVDLHNFQPSADDIVKISTCDMFIYVGGESDKWVDDALKEKVNKDMVVIDLLDVLGDSAKEEEMVEGMEADKDEEDEEEPETDEHIWLSLKNAEVFCSYFEKQLIKLNSENKKVYTDNGKAYLEKLDKLDKSYEKAVKNAEKKIMVFGDRFPFRYMVDDYGLKYYAAFVGCSAETEASFKTIAFLADKVDEYKFNSIFKIETSDGKIAETIKNTTKSKNQKILTLDSMQSKTEKDVKNEVGYLSVMEKNLKVLKEGLK